MASKNRKNKVKFKLTPELIVLVAVLVVMLVATIIMAIPSAKQNTTTKFNNSIATYNSSQSSSGSSTSSSANYLPNDHVFVEVEHSELFKKVKSNDYVYVLYGNPANSTIAANLASINSICSDLEIKEVCFYSSLWVEEFEDKDTETFNLVAKTLEDDFNTTKAADVEDFDLLTYPALLVFNKGKLVFNSQTYKDETGYNWSMYIQKAFYLSKVEQQ